ncbi:uncharacterized protein LOC143225463 isoform X2 [Tachypleus tridentatus]|uniref:uncharacterized protein LOC143225463 isoform X2 n=1 Tax=Tachypleus tridentatus TaxID=6853 RepID=UPI003FD67B06
MLKEMEKYTLWKSIFVMILSLYHLTFSLTGTEDLAPAKKHGTLREPRFNFGVFNILQFPNTPCTVGDQTGTCYSALDCIGKGGNFSGSCAKGFGVCCLFTQSCGGSVSVNNTYFVNPGYPSPSSRNEFCSMTVKKISSNICQLRLDLEQYDTVGPDLITGTCRVDSFSVSGQDINSIVPVLCGKNSGQHVYVEVGSSSGPFSVRIITSNVTYSRKWKIRVSQIFCNSINKAPPGCLQYYSGTTGLFQSFNYGNQNPEKGYLANLNYAICFRRETGMCVTNFSPEGNVQLQCGTEYFAINNMKYCNINDAPFASAVSGPIIVSVLTDELHDPIIPGFQLRYTQIACSLKK